MKYVEEMFKVLLQLLTLYDSLNMIKESALIILKSGCLC